MINYKESQKFGILENLEGFNFDGTFYGSKTGENFDQKNMIDHINNYSIFGNGTGFLHINYEYSSCFVGLYCNMDIVNFDIGLGIGNLDNTIFGYGHSKGTFKGRETESFG